MSETPLADKVMAILRNNRTLGPELETELRGLFSMSLDDIKADAHEDNQDPEQAKLADRVAESLITKLNIPRESSGPTPEQSLRALYPSLEGLRVERLNDADIEDDQRTVLEALYPSMVGNR